MARARMAVVARLTQWMRAAEVVLLLLPLCACVCVCVCLGGGTGLGGAQGVQSPDPAPRAAGLAHTLDLATQPRAGDGDHASVRWLSSPYLVRYLALALGCFGQLHQGVTHRQLYPTSPAVPHPSAHLLPTMAIMQGRIPSAHRAPCAIPGRRSGVTVVARPRAAPRDGGASAPAPAPASQSVAQTQEASSSVALQQFSELDAR